MKLRKQPQDAGKLRHRIERSRILPIYEKIRHTIPCQKIPRRNVAVTPNAVLSVKLSEIPRTKSLLVLRYIIRTGVVQRPHKTAHSEQRFIAPCFRMNQLRLLKPISFLARFNPQRLFDRQIPLCQISQKPENLRRGSIRFP